MPWVLDGMFSHGAPIAMSKLWIARQWGDQSYYLLEMCLDNDPYNYDRLFAKFQENIKYEKLHLFEWRIPGDGDDGSVIKPKDLLLQNPWIYSLRKYTSEHKAPVLGIALDKTAHHKKVTEVLRGRGYSQ